MGLWVRGQLTLMAAVFAMTSVAYFVIGLEACAVLGVFAGIAEAIPIVGPAIGAVPALIVAAASGRVELVFIVALVYVVIQIFEGNVLVPMVMRSAIGVPPFVDRHEPADRHRAGRHRRRAARGAVLGGAGCDPGARRRRATRRCRLESPASSGREPRTTVARRNPRSHCPTIAAIGRPAHGARPRVAD